MYDGVNGEPSSKKKDVDSSTDSAVYEVTWGGFSDSVSGISHFTVRLGTSAGDDDVMAAQWVSADTTWRAFGGAGVSARLAQGGKVVATVRAYDAAGNWVDKSSDGVLFDDTPPVAPVFYDTRAVIEAANSSSIVGALGHDLDVQRTKRLRILWAPFTDDESGIEKYWIRVDDVTEVTPKQVLRWSNVKLRTSFYHKSLKLKDGRTYRTTVRAFNKVGL